MTPKFQELLSQHAASSMLKQKRLGELIGEAGWGVDLGTGKVSFGPGQSYDLQVLGTESQGSQTWLWGWANEASNIPPGLLQCAASLRELGEREGIEELSQAEIALSNVEGHAFAMVASGLCGASAYYRGPYDGGALFFTVHGAPVAQSVASPIEAVNTLNAVIMQFPLNHATVARSFFEQQGFPVSQTQEGLSASLPGGGELRVRFDSQGRIAGMETTATQANMAASQATEAPAAKRPWWKLGG